MAATFLWDILTSLCRLNRIPQFFSLYYVLIPPCFWLGLNGSQAKANKLEGLDNFKVNQGLYLFCVLENVDRCYFLLAEKER